MISAASPLQVLGGIAIFVGSLGGAAAIASLARGTFTNRRQRMRREDALWGYKDEDGIQRHGAIDDFRAHIANRRIHNYDREDRGNGLDGASK